LPRPSGRGLKIAIGNWALAEIVVWLKPIKNNIIILYALKAVAIKIILLKGLGSTVKIKT
jgi:hypothetical protein